jgi:hypothetical protein
VSDWTYYVVFTEPRSSAESPDTVLRHRDGDPRSDGEVLAATDTGWKRNDLLARVFLGRNDTDLLAVSRERAAQVALRRYQDGEIPRVPADLEPDDRSR